MKTQKTNTQIRVSSIILIRWLHNNKIEVKKNISEVKKQYNSEQIGISHAKLQRANLSNEFITKTAAIKKILSSEWFASIK